MDALALALLAAGVCLEVAGLVLTLREVRRRLDALVAYDSRAITLQVHDSMHMTDSATVTLTTDRTPTLEEEVASLKSSVALLREEVVQRAREAEQRSRHAAEELAGDVRRHVDERVAELAALARSGVGSGRRAYAGPALFLGGLMLQAASSAVQLFGSS